jgi:hypothetical protein
MNLDLEQLFPILLLVVGLSVPFLALFSKRFLSGNQKSVEKRQKEISVEFKIAARETGLSYAEDASSDEIVLEGAFEGIDVEVRVNRSPHLSSDVGRLVAKPKGLPVGIEIWSRAVRATNPPTAIGDPTFDGMIGLIGARADLCLALTHAARMALPVTAISDGFAVREGEVELDLTIADRYWLQKNLVSLIHAAKALVIDEPRAARWLRNYEEESVALVALRNAACLLSEEAGAVEARAVTELILTEGAERFASLDETEDWPKVLSVVFMRRPDAALPLVAAFLESQLQEGSLVAPSGLEHLAVALGVLPGLRSRELLWRIIHAGLGGEMMALSSLSRIGEITDVEPLLELRPTFFNRSFQEQVDSAVATIQARLDGVEGGMLALTTPDESEGTLSLAESEGGLSEAREGSAG